MAPKSLPGLHTREQETNHTVKFLSGLGLGKEHGDWVWWRWFLQKELSLLWKISKGSTFAATRQIRSPIYSDSPGSPLAGYNPVHLSRVYLQPHHLSSGCCGGLNSAPRLRRPLRLLSRARAMLTGHSSPAPGGWLPLGTAFLHSGWQD